MTDYITNFINSIITFPESPVNSSFSSIGFGSTNFLADWFSKLIVILFAVLWIVLFALLSYHWRNKNNKLVRFIKNQDKKIRYESFSRFIVELTMNLAVGSLINIVFGARTGVESVISYIVASLIFALLLAFLAYLTIYPNYYYEEILEAPEKHERHALVFGEFKKKNIKWTMYYAFFVLRRILLAIVIVWMKDYLLHQCILIMLLWLWIFLYQFRYMPYESKLQNFIWCFNETVLLVYSWLMFIFLK